MSRSSLAYIDSHVDKMIAAELKNPTAHAKAVERAALPRIIAGFEVPDRKQSDGILEEAKKVRLKQVASYRKMKGELVSMLEERGVEPLACLPTKAFEMVCRQSQLYFVPKTMRTEVNPSHFLKWMSSSNDEASGPQRSATRINKGRGRTPELYFEEVGHEAVMRHLLTLKSDLQNESEEQEFQRRLAEVRGVPYVTPEFSSQASPTDGKQYDLVLPVPPEEVCETLLKLHDFELRTVAVYGAMDFAGGVLPVLHQVRKDREDRERRIQERIDWRLNDPIVYVNRGPVTAVVAQFGPFPIEQRIVDMIQATEFLPA